MSRNEGRIGTGDEAAIDGSEILRQAGLQAGRSPRQAVVARYLSASEGWKEASAELRGAFAPVPADDG